MRNKATNGDTFFIQRALFLLLLPLLVAGECEPLVHREQIEVHCEDPTTRDSLDCHSRKLPTGTVGNYECVDPYYIPQNEDIEGGKLICNNRGRWTGGPQFLDFLCKVNCGIPPLGATGFVIGGTETPPKLWPWHASIFTRENSKAEFKYNCGGTLISPFSKGFVVLTAAHCLADVQNMANVKVVLGGEFGSFKENEGVAGVQILKVRQMVLHHFYEHGASNDYKADIAVVALDGVTLNHSVLPACFSGSVDELEIGALGEIAGFGTFDSASVSFVLRNVTLPVVEPDNCFQWKRRALLPEEVCAGYNNSQSVCNVDNGGGFLFKANTSGAKRYYIQGIASHGKMDSQNHTTESCDSYSIFTKVSSYAKWIRETAVTLFTDGEELPPTITDMNDYTTTQLSEETTMLPLSTVPTPTAIVPSPPPPEDPTTPETTRVTTTAPPQAISHISNNTLSIRGNWPHQPQASIPATQKYELVSLERHNYYRKMHAAPELRLSPLMKQRAQAYADKLTREGTFANENEQGINKNVYYVTGSRVKGEDAAVSAVDSWYEDIGGYNWESPYYSTFSQIVWKETTEMGTGLATDGRRTIVVVAYYPPGNILGENGRFFKENVSPKQSQRK